VGFSILFFATGRPNPCDPGCLGDNGSIPDLAKVSIFRFLIAVGVGGECISIQRNFTQPDFMQYDHYYFRHSFPEVLGTTAKIDNLNETKALIAACI
jgi:hypothetical protein